MSAMAVSTFKSQLQQGVGESSSSRQLTYAGRSLRDDLKIGVIENNKSIDDRQKEINAKYDIVVKYQKIDSISYQWTVKPNLDQGKEVVLVVEFMDNQYANLDSIIAGAYDQYLNSFIGDILNDGNRQFWVRIMHEMNGDWYSWGTYREGNSPEKFQNAFRHVVGIFKARGANVKFQLSYNCDNPRNDPKPFIDWFPGEESVDMILCSAYNRSGVDQWHTTFDSFETVFDHGYEQMAGLPGFKALGVAEMSSTSWGGDKVGWIQDAFRSLNEKYTRVQQANWFFVNKEGDWDLNTPDEERVFGQMINQYKN
jgi:hypothetical protein